MSDNLITATNGEGMRLNFLHFIDGYKVIQSPWENCEEFSGTQENISGHVSEGLWRVQQMSPEIMHKKYPATRVTLFNPLRLGRRTRGSSHTLAGHESSRFLSFDRGTKQDRGTNASFPSTVLSLQG